MEGSEPGESMSGITGKGTNNSLKKNKDNNKKLKIPPTLVDLTIDSALHFLPYITDLSSLPDHLVVDLFNKTLQAGKLTERILRLFMETGNEYILSFVHRYIRHIVSPILPTRCSERF